jgi:tRNA (cytidine32/guanosine34-2'-O)-methyltransferase
MAPIDNVVQLVGDITRRKTVENILQRFEQQLADLVICDGAPDVTGFHDIDQYIQSQLLVAALNICLKTLKESGDFIAKVFKGSDTEFLYSQFKHFFREVHFVK